MCTDIQVLPQSKAHHQEFSWGNLTWFANRALGNSDEMTIGRCILKSGHTNGRHYHPNCSETLVVIQGRIPYRPVVLVLFAVALASIPLWAMATC